MSIHSTLTGADLHPPGDHASQHENGGSDEISVAGLSGQLADAQPTTIALMSDVSAFAKTLLDDADATTARATLGVAIGTNVQAQDAELAAIAGLTSAADKGIQFTGSGTAATYDLTAAGKALLDDADASAQRATLGLGTVATLAVDTDTTLVADSDTRVPSQKAVKAAIAAAASGGDLDDLGDVDTTGANDGDVLTFDSGDSTWKPAAPSGGGGGGGLVLLGTYVASSSATLDIITRNASGQSGAIFQSDYDEYELHLLKLVPASNAVQLWGRVSTNGGSSFATGTDYSWNDWRYVSGGAAQGGNTGETKMFMLGGGGSVDHLSNNASWGVSGRFTVVDPLSATQYKQFYGQTRFLNSGSTREGGQVVSTYESATAVDAFQFLMSSGNIASGTVRVYGIAK